MSEKRLFVAVLLPEDVRRELIEVSKHFVDINLFSGSCTRDENLHVTLDFIGQVDVDQINEIDSALKGVYASSCTAGLKNLGVLPSRRVPRILFADLDCYCLPIIARQVENVTAQFKRQRAFEIIDFGFDSNKNNLETDFTDKDFLADSDLPVNKSSVNKKKKNREFKTHATIARIKEIADIESFLYAIDNFNLPNIMKFNVKEFVLMESILLPEGPVYKVLSRYELY